MERGHAERLAPMAAAALAKAGVSIGDLDRVGVVIGPGGFTGVRVGLAFARGLGVGTGLPVVGVTSLASLAAGAGAGGRIAPVIDARRGQVYAALYGANGEILVTPFVAAPEEALNILAVGAEAAPVTLVGSGAAFLDGAPSGWTVADGPVEIDAKIVARLAAAAPTPGGPPAPLYLRAPDAKPGKPGLFDEVLPK
jgi:tRNA threonylcarbamoyladenosine biosynthesis protein TsaB